MKKVLREFMPATAVIVFMIVMSVLYGEALPDQVPVHFDINGNPDRWQSKEEFMYLLPMLMAGLMIFVSVLLRLSPKIWSMPNTRKILGMIYFGCAILMAGIHTAILLDPQVGDTFVQVFSVATALFLVLVGNLFGKECARRLARNAADNFADQMALRERVIARLGARLPPRGLFGER